MLSYIGTSDYWEASEWKKNFAISEQDQFLLKREDNNVSWSYKIVFDCEVNDRKNTLRVYYNSEWNLWNTNESGNNIRQVSNIDILETELSDTVNEKYISWQYNRGTFLLESLNKNNNFINGSWSINVLISDMFFQLHPTMKENKNITWASYDFTLDTIKKLESDSDFRNFYINSIPDYLWDKCNNNEEVLIYGANLSDDLDTKRIMKEYYEDYFFKRCRVSFNS